MLDRFTAGFGADGGHQICPHRPVFSVNADLDQAMGGERAFDLGEDGRRQALGGDTDNGIEMMGLGAQGTASGGGEGRHEKDRR